MSSNLCNEAAKSELLLLLLVLNSLADDEQNSLTTESFQRID